VAVAPLLLYVVDTGSTFVDRMRRGQRWDEPHRDHIYQRLVRGGMSHAQTTAIVATLICGVCLLAGASMRAALAARSAADVGIVAILALYASLPRLHARTQVACVAGGQAVLDVRGVPSAAGRPALDAGPVRGAGTVLRAHAVRPTGARRVS
jgi:hypothetical protein